LIEIEVRTLEELEEALAHGAEAILLDNMSLLKTSAGRGALRKLEPRVPLEFQAE
jgi:nicotinate-nucleotide pyrophosphorylase